jgi:hypothetical protein
MSPWDEYVINVRYTSEQLRYRRCLYMTEAESVVDLDHSENTARCFESIFRTIASK